MPWYFKKAKEDNNRSRIQLRHLFILIALAAVSLALGRLWVAYPAMLASWKLQELKDHYHKWNLHDRPPENTAGFLGVLEELAIGEPYMEALPRGSWDAFLGNQAFVFYVPTSLKTDGVPQELFATMYVEHGESSHGGPIELDSRPLAESIK